MELFTMGVGNYTETDIREAARPLPVEFRRPELRDLARQAHSMVENGAGSSRKLRTACGD